MDDSRPPSEILKRVCESVAGDRLSDAAATLASQLKFEVPNPPRRRSSPTEFMRIFMRDGFVDRYSGHRLVFPGTLRLLSMLFPNEFPFYPSWRVPECHAAYWHLFPTIDHRNAVSRSGGDDEDNWLTTSLVRNKTKGVFTPEELGWEVLPPGDLAEWDGLTSWFLREFEKRVDVRASRYLREWRSAALRCGMEAESRCSETGTLCACR